MTQQSEITIKSILDIDPEISVEQARRALELISGKTGDAPLLRVIRFPDAMRMLSVSRSRLYALINRGLLSRAFGSGDSRGIGITAESYNRFIDSHSRSGSRSRHQSGLTAREKRNAKRETFIRKIRWSLHINASTTRIEKYEAISRLLSSRKDIPLATACLAAGISRSAYRSYVREIATPRPPSNKAIRLDKVATIITALFPMHSTTPSLRKIHSAILEHGIKTSLKTIATLLDELGYSRPTSNFKPENAHA